MEVLCSSCRFVSYRSGKSKEGDRPWGQITLVSDSGEDLRLFVSSNRVHEFTDKCSTLSFGDLVDLTLKISPMGNGFRVTADSI